MASVETDYRDQEELFASAELPQTQEYHNLDLTDFKLEEVERLLIEADMNDPEKAEDLLFEKLEILDSALHPENNPRFAHFARTKYGLSKQGSANPMAGNFSKHRTLITAGTDYAKRYMYIHEQLAVQEFTDYLGPDRIDILAEETMEVRCEAIAKSVENFITLVQKRNAYESDDMAHFRAWLIKNLPNEDVLLLDSLPLEQRVAELDHHHIDYEIENEQDEEFSRTIGKIVMHPLLRPETDVASDDDIHEARLALESLDKMLAEKQEAEHQKLTRVLPHSDAAIPRLESSLERHDGAFRYHLIIGGQAPSKTLAKAARSVREMFSACVEKFTRHSLAVKTFTSTEVILSYYEAYNGLSGDKLQKVILDNHPKLRKNRVFNRTLDSFNTNPVERAKTYTIFLRSEDKQSLQEDVASSRTRRRFISRYQLEQLLDEGSYESKRVKEG